MTLNFIHVMQEKEFEIDFEGYCGIQEITLTIERFEWVRAGYRDETWGLDIQRLQVLAVNGNENRGLIYIFQLMVDGMFAAGKLNVEVECIDSENEVAV